MAYAFFYRYGIPSEFPFRETLAYGILAGYMAPAAKARLIRDEFEATTGVLPKYPWSRQALKDLRETLDRYNAAKANLKANDARRQGAKNLADKFARLGKIAPGDFDLDTPTSGGELEGEAGQHLWRAKASHQREGAAHVFSSWKQETPDPYDLGAITVTDAIRIQSGNIVSDYTLTPESAAEVLKKIEGEYLVKVKFLREQAPAVWVYEDGFVPLRQGRTRGGNTLEVTPETQPGALEGIDRLYYANAYPVSAVVYGLYPIREPNEENLKPMRDGDLNCVARRVIDHFEASKHGQGLTPARRQKVGGSSAQWRRHPTRRCRTREDREAGDRCPWHHRCRPLQLREVPA